MHCNKIISLTVAALKPGNQDQFISVSVVTAEGFEGTEAKVGFLTRS